MELGTNFEMEQDYTRAMANFLRAIKIEDPIHDEYQVPTIYLRMAEVFDFQKNRQQAFKYYRMALAGYKKVNDNANAANVHRYGQ